MIPISTFLSHAYEDKLIARKFANELIKHNFDVFVAHDDIGIGKEWEDKLKEEIYTRELFIVLLSNNFKNADYTDHEVGIATAYDKRIFAFSVDDIGVYGFMSRYQSKKIDPDIVPDQIEKFAEELISYTEEGKQEVNELIEELGNSRSWVESNAIARKLFKFRNFTPEQINNLAVVYLENYEVRGSWTGGDDSLKLFKRNWNIIEQKLKKELSVHLEKN